MASSPSFTFLAVSASERGALDGHGFRCSCGDRQTTSLSEAEAKRMAADHAAYHARKGA